MTTVLKLGGSILEPDPQPAHAPGPSAGLVAAIAAAHAAGERLALVHGGGKSLTALLARLGIATEFRRGLRVTTPAVLQAAVMALAGEVNTELVAALNAAGVPAVGLTGVDAGAVRARSDDPDLGAVGAVSGAEARLWQGLMAIGYVPVLASIAPDARGGLLNVNADQFAAAVAAALAAARLLFVTDVEGVLDARGAPLAAASLAELARLSAQGALHGGMLPKADACRAALQAGVGEVRIVGAAAALRLPELIAGRLRSGTAVTA
jgi:acetylglutamate kinase